MLTARGPARPPSGCARWQPPWIELVLGTYLMSAAVLAARTHLWSSVPFLLLFALGFLLVCGLSLTQHVNQVGARKTFAEAKLTSREPARYHR